MAIGQCPRCELKFAHRSEMQWHLREDHPVPTVPDSPVTLLVQRAEGTEQQDRPARRRWSRLWPSRRSP